MSIRTLGDVIARHGPCISISEDASVRELANKLVHHRVQAIVVLTSRDMLAGIATTRDVVKVIARNHDLDATLTADVMTSNPITLPSDNTPAKALALMREGRFRHIPVVDGDRVLGVVDVLSLAYDAITRLQLSYNMIPTRRGIDLLRAARDTIEKPTLRPMVARSGALVTLRRADSVAKACEVIATNHVAAVVVVEEKTGVLDGIFTCTDLVKRVIAKERDPDATLLADVMTPNPDSASPDFTILESLQRMQACGFRNLPVVDDESRVVVGLVDVLQLASDTLLDFRVAAEKEKETEPGSPPARKRATSPLRRNRSPSLSPKRASRLESFASSSSSRRENGGSGGARGFIAMFGSLFANSFGNRAPSPRMDQGRMLEAARCLTPSSSKSGLRSAFTTPTRQNSSSRSHNQSGGGGSSSGAAEDGTGAVVPSASARPPLSPPSSSSSTAATHGLPGLPASSDMVHWRRHYSYLGTDMSGRVRHARRDIPLATFKFKDLNEEFRRIKVPMVLEKGDFDKFVLDVRRRFSGSSRIGSVKIKYIDEDGDEVVIANDDDLASCFEEFVDKASKTIHLRVTEMPSHHHHHHHANTNSSSNNSKIQSPVSSAPSSAAASPTQSASSARSQVEVEPLSRTTIEPPPVEHPYREPSKPTGVYRTASKSVIHTPSSLKAAEGHRKMLDGQVEDAIGLFDEALALDGDNARAQGERAAARLLSGNSVAAEEDYRTAIALLEAGKGGRRGDMSFQMCVVGLVEALIDQRRYEEAVVVAGEIDAENSGNTGCVDAFRDELDSAGAAAVQALEAGDHGDAMSCFSNALRVETAYRKLVPTEAARSSLRLGRAKCYKLMEDYDMALEDYEAAVEIEPESVAGHKGCGKCLAELEQMERALEAYERAHKLDSGDDEVTKEMETLRRLLPDPMEGKKEEIAKLGALLGSMNLPGKQS